MSWLKANRVSVPQKSAKSIRFKHNSSLQVRTQCVTDTQNRQIIKSNPSFSLSKNNKSTTLQKLQKSSPKIMKSTPYVKLPELHRKQLTNPQKNKEKQKKTYFFIYYQSLIHQALKSYENKYMYNQARLHFNQTIQILRMTKKFKVNSPKVQIHLQNKTKFKKTVYLDLDQTLIHTDQNSKNYTVKLKFPMGVSGGYIQAGVRIRPYCDEFLQQISKVAQIIIFTASSSSYADVILDYLDPNNKYFSHRLYRQHCTLEGGFYVKDLRTVNRNLENVVIVDNSAFSYALQKQNGIPIIPFYHYKQDKQLQNLLPFIKKTIQSEDCRTIIQETFCWEQYLKEKSSPKKIFNKIYKKLEQAI